MALARTNESMSCSINKKHCDIYFHSYDLVYINTAHFSLVYGLYRKLAPKWVGPFPIDQVISSVAYYIGPPEEYGLLQEGFALSSSPRLHGKLAGWDMILHKASWSLIE